MSNTTGIQIYNQSMNGLINIENADTIQVFELDSEIITTDNLTVNNSATINNLSLSSLSSNLIQSNTNIINQTGTGINILKDTDFNGNVVVSGNLTIDGDLIYDHVNIDVDNLIVRDSALFECDVSMNGNLRVNNFLRIGIDDPAGGSGDTATIEYRSYNIGTEGTVLRLNTTNDANDNINLNPSGRVGIKTDSPASTLDVNGDCYINTILTTGGDTNVNGNLDVNNVLRTYPTSIRYDYVYNLTTPLNVVNKANVEILTFSVIPNVSGNFTVGYVCPISVKENGSRPLTNDVTTTTTINSVTANLYINNNLYKQQGAFFNGAYGVTHSFTVAKSAIPSLNPYNYEKYLNILSDTFSIEHTSQPTVSNYKIELVVNYTRTNILSTSVYNLILNTTQSGYTQLAILSFSPAVVANYTAPRQDTIRDIPRTTDTGSILCNETYTNNIYCKNLYVDNVLETIQFQDTGITNSLNYPETGLFVTTETEILNFTDIPSNGYNASLSLKCPLSLYESGNYTGGSSGTGSSITSITFYLYRNGNLILTQSGTFSNPGYFNWTFVTNGSYSYNRFTHTCYGTLNFSIPPNSTASTYSLKMNMVNIRNYPVSGSTYGYIANTSNSGNNYTGVVRPSTYTPFTPYEAPEYLFTITGYTPPYSIDNGYLVNNTLVNNKILNQGSLFTGGLVNSLVRTITTSTITLPETPLSNIYLMGFNSGMTVNLTNAGSEMIGVIIHIRKIPPLLTTNNIFFVPASGCVLYNNLTAYTSSVAFSNTYYTLFYRGSGVWLFFNRA